MAWRISTQSNVSGTRHTKPDLVSVQHTTMQTWKTCMRMEAGTTTWRRVEFYREHTLLSCGSPRFYRVVAGRLLRKEDTLRQHVDCALLYYTLARVSIESDEMMQEAPKRALNKVFARLKDRNTDREHVELIFNLQQTVLEGLEYLEENKRELPIWGIPPFGNHQVSFHPEHTPSSTVHDLIQKDLDLVDKDFDMIIGHWKSLERRWTGTSTYHFNSVCSSSRSWPSRSVTWPPNNRTSRLKKPKVQGYNRDRS
jgi:hypothetical protein